MLALDYEPKTVIFYVLPNCFDHIPFFIGERFKGLLGHGFSQCFGRTPSILTAPAWPPMGSACPAIAPAHTSRATTRGVISCGMTCIELLLDLVEPKKARFYPAQAPALLRFGATQLPLRRNSAWPGKEMDTHVCYIGVMNVGSARSALRPLCLQERP